MGSGTRGTKGETLSLLIFCDVFFSIAIAAWEIFQYLDRNKEGNRHGCPCICVKRIIYNSKIKSNIFFFRVWVPCDPRAVHDFSSSARLLKASKNSDFDHSRDMILAVCFYLNQHNWKRGKGGKKVHKKSYLYVIDKIVCCHCYAY